MLALSTIFWITFLTAAIVVWLYRTLSGWQVVDRTQVDPTVTKDPTEMGVQQGFMSLISARHKRVKNVELSTLQGENKAPWGW